VRDKGGGVIGVIEVYDDVTQLFRAISSTRWQVFGLSALLMSALYVALLIIVQRADKIVAVNQASSGARGRATRAHRGRGQARAASDGKGTARKPRRLTPRQWRRAALPEEANQAKTEFLGKTERRNAYAA